MRTIRFLQAADDVNGENVRGTIAVVADVLRATSTIVTALYNGCKTVMPVKEVNDARDTAARFNRHDIILGGEREGKRIDGFDFGNSPQDYTSGAIKDKTFITTTTNGTKALVHAADAELTLVLSFLNLSSVADFVLEKNSDVSAIGAGIYGDFSLEDSVCCGLFIDQLVEKAPDQFELDVAAENILEISRTYKGKIEQLLSDSPHGDFLRNIGYESDLMVCANVDSCNIVPLYANGRVTIINEH